MAAPTGTFDDEIPWGESYYTLYLDMNLTSKLSDPTQVVYSHKKPKWLHEITAREDGCIAEPT